MEGVRARRSRQRKWCICTGRISWSEDRRCHWYLRPVSFCKPQFKLLLDWNQRDNRLHSISLPGTAFVACRDKGDEMTLQQEARRCEDARKNCKTRPRPEGSKDKGNDPEAQRKR